MSAVVDAARAWADRHLADREFPAQVDLDGLIDDDPAPEAVQVALECGQALLSRVNASGHDLEVLVVIPLEDAEDLAKTVPPLSDVAEMRWAYGPGIEVPGLYIVEPATLATFEPVEEYRLALSGPEIPPGFVAYYRCWRDHEAAQRGWEFSRAIYVRSDRTSGGGRNAS